jgi:hypothetical protein
MNFRYATQKVIEICREVSEFQLVDRKPCRFEFISQTFIKKLNLFALNTKVIKEYRKLGNNPNSCKSLKFLHVGKRNTIRP